MTKKRLDTSSIMKTMVEGTSPMPAPQPVMEPAPEPVPAPEKRPAGRPTAGRPPIYKEGEMVKKAVYMPVDVAEALRYKQFMEPHLSQSGHILAALKIYLNLE